MRLGHASGRRHHGRAGQARGGPGVGGPGQAFRRKEGEVKQYDAVVVGGGHNALVAATRLACERWKVLVLERRPVLGGAASAAEIFPGCAVNVAAQDAGLFPAGLAADLDLAAHGLEWIHPPALATSLTGGGEALTLWRDPARTMDEIARHSRADAARFPDWADHLRTMARVLRVALDHPAPPPHPLAPPPTRRQVRPPRQGGGGG
ncbi:MAG: NAD(P)/FAD-dependent oxidoreductase, partial [Gemmatimonadetes bacterium]|nr:NAD(P)/FAD-dependent oxidoreductase [Gemmatimonadota bacterium]